MKTNIRQKSKKTSRGFTLIELIVAIFIFSVITVSIVSVFVSVTKSYQKSKAIKFVKESAEFALTSIAKDVRMGKIEKSATYSDGSRKDYFLVTRNRTQQKVCYIFSKDGGDDLVKLSVIEGTSNCSGTEKVLVDLSGTGMTFKADSGFRACPSAEIEDIVADPGYFDCPSSVSAELRRGWVEMNLEIGNPSMETDEIKIQTVVSSRDYGWGDVP
jgi:prepilin-type N-terminal cleavage/methylation domain-containing protein